MRAVLSKPAGRAVKPAARPSKPANGAPPDFAPASREVYIEPLATLDFDKAAWIDRARECSRRAFRGVATRATCRLDFDLQGASVDKDEVAEKIGDRKAIVLGALAYALGLVLSAGATLPIRRAPGAFFRGRRPRGGSMRTGWSRIT